MTKQLTRQEVGAVVERLADKTLSFGCSVLCGGNRHTIGGDYELHGKTLYTRRFCDGCPPEESFPITEILGHPIYIGAVLDYAIRKPGGLPKILKEEIFDTWFTFGLGRSLQEIIEASGWEEVEVVKIRNGHWECHYKGEVVSNHSMREGAERYANAIQPTLTSPEANALFSFLQQLL